MKETGHTGLNMKSGQLREYYENHRTMKWARIFVLRPHPLSLINSINSLDVPHIINMPNK